MMKLKKKPLMNKVGLILKHTSENMEIGKVKSQNKYRLKTEDHKNTNSNKGLILFGKSRVGITEKTILDLYFSTLSVKALTISEPAFFS